VNDGGMAPTGSFCSSLGPLDVSEDGTGESCLDGQGLLCAEAVVVSPDEQ